jgi:hypothetical protein
MFLLVETLGEKLFLYFAGRAFLESDLTTSVEIKNTYTC